MDPLKLNFDVNNRPKPQKSQLLDIYETNTSWVRKGDVDGGGREDS